MSGENRYLYHDADSDDSRCGLNFDEEESRLNDIERIEESEYPYDDDYLDELIDIGNLDDY